MTDANVMTADNATATGVFAGLALWLVPKSGSKAATVLPREMQALRFSFYPDSPAFGCHATLISGISKEKHGEIEQIVKTARAAIHTWSQRNLTQSTSKNTITASFKDVTTRGSYFQCILIALHRNNEALSTLNHQMREAFNLKDQPEYFPHISLLYADLTSQQAESRIRAMEQQGVFKRLPHSQGESSATTTAIDFAGLTEVEFADVQLYDCNGAPDTWKLLHSLPLSG